MATRARPPAQRPSDVADDYGIPGDPPWIEVDWSRHLRRADLLGSSVNYVDLGEGPPVMFVHGLSGCWQNWLENIPYFAQRHRVIALDLPGFGHSTMPSERVSIPLYGRLLDALLDHLSIDTVSLIGNSMGGFVSAELAITEPARVGHLALVCAAGVHGVPGRATPSHLVRAAGVVGVVTNALIRRSDALVRRPRGRRLLLGTICRYPEQLRPEMCIELLMGAGKPAFKDALHSVLTYDFRHELTAITVPTLIVWGRDDMVVPVRSAHRYERLLQNARSEKVILDKTGHVPMVERARTFNRLVEDLISR